LEDCVNGLFGYLVKLLTVFIATVCGRQRAGLAGSGRYFKEQGGWITPGALAILDGLGHRFLNQRVKATQTLSTQWRSFKWKF
jgi:hypothetical protein